MLYLADAAHQWPSGYTVECLSRCLWAVVLNSQIIAHELQSYLFLWKLFAKCVEEVVGLDQTKRQ